MAKYIKSYSNYVLNKKHQTINDGTVFERDMSTIGGKDNFTKGQVTTYKSGNFVISVNGEASAKKTKNSIQWEENENGAVWKYDDVKDVVSSQSDHNKIVVNKNTTDLSDYAYFGSCVELIRGSINDILSKFPGELYAPILLGEGVNVPYIYKVVDGFHLEKNLGGDDYFLVDNPFNINIYDTYARKDNDYNELKYFANDGYKNYEIITVDDKGNETKEEVVSYTVTESKKPKCLGNLFATVTIKSKTKTFVVYIYYGNGMRLVYLTQKAYLGIAVRPKTEFYDKFIDSLDIFEKVLMNPNTKPKYKATFEVYYEDDYGMHSRLEDFVFPTSYGGYNIGQSEDASYNEPYNSYINSLSEIAYYYDERFCDNMYRNMTHESIKNFDWTNSREEDNDDAEDILDGADKVAKTIRLLGREFDEIKNYIDGIGYSDTITYNGVNNCSDYLITDNLDIKGWDISQINPLSLSEYIEKDDKKYLRKTNGKLFTNEFLYKDTSLTYTVNETTNKAGDITLSRTFGFVNDLTVKPYDTTGTNGYFLACDCPSKSLIKIYPTSNEIVYFDECANVLRNLIKSYESPQTYTVDDVNKHFFKTLSLNSKSILSKKGTIESIDEVMSLFGLRNKNWFNSLPKGKKQEIVNNKIDNSNTDSVTKYEGDYEIKEFSLFTRGLKDNYRDEDGVSWINYYNKTKTTTYPSNEYLNGVYVDYQGLPVSYRYDETNKCNIVYPYFSKYGYYDGNPYYQMNGGWFETKPFRFDNSNNIIKASSNDDNGSDLMLFTETLNCVKTLNKLPDLLSNSVSDTANVVYIQDLSTRYEVVDGYLYELYKDDLNASGSHEYFILEVFNGYANLGDDTFEGVITVSNPYSENNMMSYDLDKLENGFKIKVYILDDGKFKIESNLNYEFEQYIFSYDESSNKTHYFKLNEDGDSTILNDNYGWKHLSNDEFDFYKINAIRDYFKGNNPHSGNFKYDNGYEYLSYFKNLFKNAYENDEFDDRCFPIHVSYESDIKMLYNLGFSDIPNKYDYALDNEKLIEDSKIHYFGNKYVNKNGTWNKKDYVFDTFDGAVSDNKWYMSEIITTPYDKAFKYNKFVGNETKTSVDNVTVAEIDGYTEQIINTKRVHITFYVNANNEYDKQYLEIVKYYDSVVLPYLKQVIPMNVIVTTSYELMKQGKVIGEPTNVTYRAFVKNYYDELNACYEGEFIPEIILYKSYTQAYEGNITKDIVTIVDKGITLSPSSVLVKPNESTKSIKNTFNVNVDGTKVSSFDVIQSAGPCTPKEDGKPEILDLMFDLNGGFSKCGANQIVVDNVVAYGIQKYTDGTYSEVNIKLSEGDYTITPDGNVAENDTNVSKTIDVVLTYDGFSVTKHVTQEAGSCQGSGPSIPIVTSTTYTSLTYSVKGSITSCGLNKLSIADVIVSGTSNYSDGSKKAVSKQLNYSDYSLKFDRTITKNMTSNKVNYTMTLTTSSKYGSLSKTSTVTQDAGPCTEDVTVKRYLVATPTKSTIGASETEIEFNVSAITAYCLDDVCEIAETIVLSKGDYTYETTPKLTENTSTSEVSYNVTVKYIDSEGNQYENAQTTIKQEGYKEPESFSYSITAETPIAIAYNVTTVTYNVSAVTKSNSTGQVTNTVKLSASDYTVSLDKEITVNNTDNTVNYNAVITYNGSDSNFNGKTTNVVINQNPNAVSYTYEISAATPYNIAWNDVDSFNPQNGMYSAVTITRKFISGTESVAERVIQNIPNERLIATPKSGSIAVNDSTSPKSNTITLKYSNTSDSNDPFNNKTYDVVVIQAGKSVTVVKRDYYISAMTVPDTTVIVGEEELDNFMFHVDGYSIYTYDDGSTKVVTRNDKPDISFNIIRHITSNEITLSSWIDNKKHDMQWKPGLKDEYSGEPNECKFTTHFTLTTSDGKVRISTPDVTYTYYHTAP